MLFGINLSKQYITIIGNVINYKWPDIVWTYYNARFSIIRNEKFHSQTFYTKEPNYLRYMKKLLYHT